MVKMKELLEKQTDQLRHELVEKQKHLFDLRSQAVTEKLEDPSQLGKTKKEIARILTVLSQREAGQRQGQEKKAPATQASGQPAAGGQKASDAQDGQPAFGRRTRINAVKQKVRARRTGGGKTAARKLKARTEMYRHRRKARAANSK
jgi:large subunit ribosomal protein L29